MQPYQQQLVADPYHLSPVGFVIPVADGFVIPDASPAAARPVRRYKTVKRIQLQDGHLVVDVPVPERYLEKVTLREGHEFTHMRYTAITCDPDDFVQERYFYCTTLIIRFTLRQQHWQRHTEIAMCLTMYNVRIT